MRTLAAILGPFLLLLAPLAAQAEPAAVRRPNILFCLADDWGWPHAGVLGDEVVATPTFDRIANEGVLFERAFVSSPSCTPSRNAILTGQQFYRLGEGANLHSTLDVKHPNFMFALEAAGYRIGHWRKAWGPGEYQAGGYERDPCGPRSGFDAFLEGLDPEQPFCFWFGTSDPHRGYRRGSGEQAGIDPAKVHVPAFFPDRPEVRGDLADYYFEVQRWDSDVGRALALLEERELLDDTIVVMSGDHGMPFPRCKGNLYDHGARVPLAIRWGAAGTDASRVASVVSLIDLAPTFLAAAGVPIPASMTGSSLLPFLGEHGAGAQAAAREFVILGRERHTPAQAFPSLVGYPSRALRDERWLLILNLEPERWPAGVPADGTHPMKVHADCDNGPTKRLIVDRREEPEFADSYRLCFEPRPAVELYDCRADPEQLRNLAGTAEHAERLATLRRHLEKRLQATGDPRFTDEPVRFDEYPYRAGYLEKRLREGALRR